MFLPSILSLERSTPFSLFICKDNIHPPLFTMQRTGKNVCTAGCDLHAHPLSVRHIKWVWPPYKCSLPDLISRV